jgi:UDPglucose 6-dehydrogenase
MKDSHVYFIAVGTPPGEDGSADLKHVLQVAREIGQNLQEYGLVVDKSTVPVGTADKVRDAIREVLAKRQADIPFDVASNPEFLKEGAAVSDFMRPDRIVVGTDSEKAGDILREVYAPFNRNRERTIFMGVRDAEMTKYAANAMLATKISFINEMANLCDCLGVDVENVRRGIGADSRIGYSFIYPGVGYGGSCFPKDVRALIHMAEECDLNPEVLRSVHCRNEAQKHVLFSKISKRFGEDLSGISVGIWGLAFKPETDDMREAPSVVLLHELVAAGARIKAYDPVAMDVAREVLPKDWFETKRLELADHQYAALEGVDALAVVTEWKPFRHPDFAAMKRMMKQSIIFDGRNLYEPSSLRNTGFEYSGIGR